MQAALLFLEGIVTFISPCLLPMLPVYISFFAAGEPGRRNMNTKNMTFFSALLFGIAFSVGWTPCVGAFLGSALMMASSEGSTLAGVWMLLVYSLGLGLPFVLSALLIDRLKGAFDWIKRHYRAINLISGGLLILVGVLMATGLLGRLLALLSF